jgi:hypothetical protein
MGLDAFSIRTNALRQKLLYPGRSISDYLVRPSFAPSGLMPDVLRCCGEDGVFGDVGRVVAYALERARD